MNLLESLNLLSYNTDAIATNRGFYFQYLHSMEKWVSNYLDGKPTKVILEHQADLVELGDEWVFTETKCTCADLTPHSKAFKRTLYYFFCLYLRFREEKTGIRFRLISTSAPGKKIAKKLLKREEGEKRFSLKAAGVLRNVVRSRMKEVLSQAHAQETPQKLKQVQDLFEEEIESQDFLNFMSKVSISVGGGNTEKAIADLESKVFHLVERLQKSPSVEVVFSVLLSEIVRRSQQEENDDRILSRELMDQLLRLPEAEFYTLVDRKLQTVYLFLESSLKSIHTKLELTTNRTLANEKRIVQLEERQDTELEIPKEIVPILQNPFFLIRGEELDRLGLVLDDSQIPINVFGLAGTGKTSLVTQFWDRFKHNFDFALWLDGGKDFLNEIAFSPRLGVLFDFPFSREKNLHLRYHFFCQKLWGLSGEKLLVIDNLRDSPDIQSNILEWNQAGWKVLLTSRYKFNWTKDFQICSFSDRELSEIFTQSVQKEIILDDFPRLLDLLERNPYLVNYVGKTLSNAPYLELSELINALENVELDLPRFSIELPDDEAGASQTLKTRIITEFNTKHLGLEDQVGLLWIAVISESWIDIELLGRIGGEDFFEKNLASYMNLINRAEKWGIVERKVTQFKMYRQVRWAILYDSDDFIGLGLLISWLVRRMHEAGWAYSPLLNDWAGMAKSVLANIPERKREGLIQPLLTLENALLEAFRIFGITDGLEEKQLKLISNWEKINDPKGLANALFCLGAGYYLDMKHDLAKESFEEGMSMLDPSFLSSGRLRIDSFFFFSLNRLSLSIDMEDEETFQECMEYLSIIEEKVNLHDHIPRVEFYLEQGRHGFVSGNIEGAISFMSKALKIEEAKKEPRPFILGLIHYRLAWFYLNLGKWLKVRKAIKASLSEFRKAKLYSPILLYRLKTVAYYFKTRTIPRDIGKTILKGIPPMMVHEEEE